MANTYAFTQLDFPGVSATFQVITGINNAGTLVGYFGNGQPLFQNLSTSFLWQPTNGIGQFTAFGNKVAGTQIRIRSLNNAPTPTAIGTSLSGAGTVTGAVTVAPTPGATPANGPAASGGGTNPHLVGISDAGAEVGYYVVDAGTATEHDVAASVQGNSLVAITLTLPVGSGTITSSHATGIDFFGDIAGTMTVSGASVQGGVSPTVEGFVAFVGNPSVTVFDVPGAVSTEILAFNNERQVAGDYVDGGGTTHGFVYDFDSGKLTTIDVSGATATAVYGINDQGDLVGSFVDASGATHGFLDALLTPPSGGPQAVTNPLAGSTVALVKGADAVRVGGVNAVTLLDPGFGNATLIANAGNDTVSALGSSDTIVADLSGASISIEASQSDHALIFLGTGRNSVRSGAAATVVASSGADSIVADGSLVFAAVGATGVDTVMAAPTLRSSSASTIVAGAGRTVVTGLGSVAGTIVFGGSGTVVVNPSTVTAVGAATMVGGAGKNYFFEGAGGGLLFGGSGVNQLVGNSVAVKSGTLAATTIVAGSGQATVTGYAGTVFLTGTADQVAISGIAASIGNLSLVGTGSTGNDAYVLGTAGAKDQVFEGPGRNTVFFGNGGAAQVTEGSGSTLFYLASNVVSGADTIYGFKPGTDSVQLQNYDATAVARAVRATAPAPGGSSVITLNGVRIEFYGVSGITTSSFGPG